MLKLSEVLVAKKAPMKKAAGEDLVVWDEEVEKPKKRVQEEARVLPFPSGKTTVKDVPSMPVEGKEDEEAAGQVLGSDLLLWQREISRSKSVESHKVDAFKGYRKSTEMYVVKEASTEGKDKIRFASTNGVLVNKKQA